MAGNCLRSTVEHSDVSQIVNRDDSIMHTIDDRGELLRLFLLLLRGMKNALRLLYGLLNGLAARSD